MKAKEYAKKFNASPDITTITEICNMFIFESKEIADQRQVRTESGLVAVFKELDNKWKAFCRLAVDFDGEPIPDRMFQSCVSQIFPDSISQSIEWRNYIGESQ